MSTQKITFVIDVKGLRHVNRQFSATRKGAAGLVGSLASLRGLIGGLGAAQVLRGLVQLGSDFQQMQRRLGTVSGSAEAVSANFKELVDLSFRTRTDIEKNVVAFQKLSVASERLGISSAGTMKILTTLNQAFQLGGATAQEMRSALMQLGQALASDKLAGDELRSIMENAPILAKVMADQIGVSLGQFRNMGREGKLTSKVIVEAIQGAEKTVGRQFAKLPKTFQDAVTQFKNTMVVMSEALVPALNKVTKAMEKISEKLLESKEITDAIANTVEAGRLSIVDSFMPGLVDSSQLGPGQAFGNEDEFGFRPKFRISELNEKGVLAATPIVRALRIVAESSGESVNDLAKRFEELGAKGPEILMLAKAVESLDTAAKAVEVPRLVDQFEESVTAARAMEIVLGASREELREGLTVIARDLEQAHLEVSINPVFQSAELTEILQNFDDEGAKVLASVFRETGFREALVRAAARQLSAATDISEERLREMAAELSGGNEEVEQRILDSLVSGRNASRAAKDADINFERTTGQVVESAISNFLPSLTEGNFAGTWLRGFGFTVRQALDQGFLPFLQLSDDLAANVQEAIQSLREGESFSEVWRSFIADSVDELADISDSRPQNSFVDAQEQLYSDLFFLPELLRRKDRMEEAGLSKGSEELDVLEELGKEFGYYNEAVQIAVSRFSKDSWFESAAQWVAGGLDRALEKAFGDREGEEINFYRKALEETLHSSDPERLARRADILDFEFGVRRREKEMEAFGELKDMILPDRAALENEESRIYRALARTASDPRNLFQLEQPFDQLEDPIAAIRENLTTLFGGLGISVDTLELINKNLKDIEEEDKQLAKDVRSTRINLGSIAHRKGFPSPLGTSPRSGYILEEQLRQGEEQFREYSRSKSSAPFTYTEGMDRRIDSKDRLLYGLRDRSMTDEEFEASIREGVLSRFNISKTLSEAGIAHTAVEVDFIFDQQKARRELAEALDVSEVSPMWEQLFNLSPERLEKAFTVFGSEIEESAESAIGSAINPLEEAITRARARMVDEFGEGFIPEMHSGTLLSAVIEELEKAEAVMLAQIDEVQRSVDGNAIRPFAIQRGWIADTLANTEGAVEAGLISPLRTLGQALAEAAAKPREEVAAIERALYDVREIDMGALSVLTGAAMDEGASVGDILAHSIVSGFSEYQPFEKIAEILGSASLAGELLEEAEKTREIFFLLSSPELLLKLAEQIRESREIARKAAADQLERENYQRGKDKITTEVDKLIDAEKEKVRSLDIDPFMTEAKQIVDKAQVDNNVLLNLQDAADLVKQLRDVLAEVDKETKAQQLASSLIESANEYSTAVEIAEIAVKRFGLSQADADRYLKELKDSLQAEDFETAAGRIVSATKRIKDSLRVDPFEEQAIAQLREELGSKFDTLGDQGRDDAINRTADALRVQSIAERAVQITRELASAQNDVLLVQQALTLAVQEYGLSQAEANKYLKDYILQSGTMPPIKQAFEELEITTKDLEENLGRGLQSAIQGTSRAISDFVVGGMKDMESFREGLANVFEQIAQELMQMIVQMLIYKAISAAIGKPNAAAESYSPQVGMDFFMRQAGGPIEKSSLVSSLPRRAAGGPTAQAGSLNELSSLVSSLPRRAAGGPSVSPLSATGGLTMVGELGPELFATTRAGNITANNRLPVQNSAPTIINVSSREEAEAYLNSAEGREVIINTVRQNRRAIGQ